MAEKLYFIELSRRKNNPTRRWPEDKAPHQKNTLGEKGDATPVDLHR